MCLKSISRFFSIKLTNVCINLTVIPRVSFCSIVFHLQWQIMTFITNYFPMNFLIKKLGFSHLWFDSIIHACVKLSFIINHFLNCEFAFIWRFSLTLHCKSYFLHIRARCNKSTLVIRFCFFISFRIFFTFRFCTRMSGNPAEENE